MKKRPPDPKPGDPILADHITAIWDALAEIGIDVVAPLVLRDNTISWADEPGFWAKITGAPSGTAHPWIEQHPAAAGTWTTGTRSGTTSVNPAYELNGSTATLTDKLVWMRRTVALDYRFPYGAC